LSASDRAKQAAPGLPSRPMSTFPLGPRQVRRSGYGAMQLAGPWATNAPPDRASAIGVLRAAVTAGVDHLDTAQYCLPRGAANPVLTSPAVRRTAARHGATPSQVALKWLLQLAPNVLLIPGTGSAAHLQENMAAEHVTLDEEALRELAGVGA
jgi:aryl-alcohol dehydrogenase-like predicted oxidoreductase